MDMCSTQKMTDALSALSMSKTVEGNRARAELLKRWGVKVPRLYGDVVVVIAREAIRAAQVQS